MARSSKSLASLATTIAFDKFWSWLMHHQNCILRAGTSNVMLCDHDDFHWTLFARDEMCFVQLARAKDLVGEMIVYPSEISYVQAEPNGTDGEWIFDCISEDADAREISYHFVLSHEYEAAEHSKSEKWTH